MRTTNFSKSIEQALHSFQTVSVPLLLAACVGVLTGFVVVGFIHLIDFIHDFFFITVRAKLGFLGIGALILIPAIGGLLVGPIVTFFAPEAKGHGVPEVMKSIALRGGKIRGRVVVVKAIASALSIGTGASVGREGPIVQIGSALGSHLAQIFQFRELRIKNLVACGAAAGVAGVFNTPIAGVMFALEVILKDFGARSISTVAVAAVSASIVSRSFLGVAPAFKVPIYNLVSPYEIFLYLVLGVLSAFAAFLFISVLYKSEQVWDEWQGCPEWAKAALGGIILGCMGVFAPQVLGSGLSTIGETLLGNIPMQLMLALVFLKIFATSISLGSGSSGGVFAPALFIGAVLGGSFGKFFEGRTPFEIAPSGAYALVGMASVFAAGAHAPVTAILIVFEMTGDYQIILPLMITTVVAVSLSQALRRESIYTIKLKERGIDFESMSGTSVLASMQVRDVMVADFEQVPREMPAREVLQRMAKEKNKPFYVVDRNGDYVGEISRQELSVLLDKDLDAFLADDLVSSGPEICSEEDVLSHAAHFMTLHGVSEMVVMKNEQIKKVVGVLKSTDIFHALTSSGEKRDALLSRADFHDSHLEGRPVQIRFSVHSRSPIANQEIRTIGIPNGVVFTSILRKNKSLIPEGSTVLLGRDKVWAVITPTNEQIFLNWLKLNKMQILHQEKKTS